MAQKAIERRYIRAVMRQVHPDLFQGHPHEQGTNSESLKALHGAVEQLSKGERIDPLKLKFYVREEGITANSSFALVNVALRNSLVPLYEAFGVVNEQEAAALRQSEASDEASAIADIDFLTWLDETIQEASVTAAELASRRQVLANLKHDIVHEFALADITPALERPAGITSVADIRTETEAMVVVRDALRHRPEVARLVKGLRMRVYAPSSAPVKDFHWVDPATGQDRHVETIEWADVAPNGDIEVVAGGDDVCERLEALDLPRAQRLASLNRFWRARRQTLSRHVATAMGVKYVWTDDKLGDELFCLWAGRVLRDRSVQDLLSKRTFKFSVLVHADPSSPAATFLETCGTLQVHHQCAPKQLVEYLLSHSAVLANEDSSKRIEDSATERELLAAAKKALGAKHVVRICASEHSDDVARALRRLIEHADVIRTKLDLSNVCLAIDDNYHLWDSGYVSIPYNFDISTMPKEVQLLLTAGGEMSSEKSPREPADGAKGGEKAPAANNGAGAQQNTASAEPEPEPASEESAEEEELVQEVAASVNAVSEASEAEQTVDLRTKEPSAANGASEAAASDEPTLRGEAAVSNEARTGGEPGSAEPGTSQADADAAQSRFAGFAAEIEARREAKAQEASAARRRVRIELFGDDVVQGPAPKPGSGKLDSRKAQEDALRRAFSASRGPELIPGVSLQQLSSAARAPFNGARFGRANGSSAVSTDSGVDAAARRGQDATAPLQLPDASAAAQPSHAPRGASAAGDAGKSWRSKSVDEHAQRRKREVSELQAFQERLQAAIGVYRDAHTIEGAAAPINRSFRVQVQELASTVRRARNKGTSRNNGAADSARARSRSASSSSSSDEAARDGELATSGAALPSMNGNDAVPAPAPVSTSDMLFFSRGEHSGKVAQMSGRAFGVGARRGARTRANACYLPQREFDGVLLPARGAASMRGAASRSRSCFGHRMQVTASAARAGSRVTR